MAWTDIFGGQTVNPQDLSYKSYSFAASVSLLWDNTTADASRVVADIMDVTTTAAGVVVSMPDARQAGAGEAALFFNAGAESFDVVSATGVAIITLAPGEGWYVWLRDNTTQSGLWRAIEFGAGTSTASAASLASATVKASGAALVQAMPVFTLGADYTTGAGERGKLIRWSGGVGTLTLDLAATVGGDWFCAINNSGTGTLTIAPSGSDQIDASASSILLNPGDTFSLASDGSSYFSWAKSFSPINQFTFTSISVAGTGNYTLSSVELGFSLYEFTGILTGNRNIIVPAAVAPFRVINSTSGSYSLTVKTAAGTGVSVLQNGSKFLACTGTNVVDVVSLGISTPISVADGGTGATTASGARTNLGATSVGNAVFTAADAGAARTAIGVTAAASPVFTGQASFAAGSASAPSITFTGDLNTGMWSPGADTLAASTNGAERLRITSTGNVGIGTSSPSASLHIERDGGGAFRVENITTTNFASSQFVDDSGNGLSIINYGSAYAAGSVLNVGAGGVVLSSTTDMAINASGTKTLRFGINNAERLRIDASGNVGIGTTSPNAAARLDVTSTTSGFLPPRMTTTQRDAITSPPNGLILYDTTTNKLQVRAGGAWVNLH